MKFTKNSFSQFIKNDLANLPSIGQELHERIIGFLLSDAGVYRTTKSLNSNCRLEFSFGKNRIEFALWVESLLKDFISNPLASLIVASTKDGLKNNISYRLKTKSLPIFNYYRDIFYKIDPVTNKYKKIVPLNINDLITPIVLSTIIIGDGNYHLGNNIVRIYTNSFTFEEVNLLKNAINNVLNIKVYVQNHRNNQFILVIPSSEIINLQNMVKSYIEKSILYRIGL
jgi:hypothetical protein